MPKKVKDPRKKLEKELKDIDVTLANIAKEIARQQERLVKITAKHDEVIAQIVALPVG